METGDFKSWKRAGKAFPKSGQGEAQLVSRISEFTGLPRVILGLRVTAMRVFAGERLVTGELEWAAQRLFFSVLF